MAIQTGQGSLATSITQLDPNSADFQDQLANLVGQIQAPAEDVKTSIANVNGRSVLINTQTGEVISDLGIANSEISGGGAGGLTPGQIQSVVSGIVNQFDTEPVVKNFNVIAEGYEFAKDLGTKENPTSADDQGLIYAFAKVMDPNSVVRESEYTTVQKYSQSMIQSGWANAKRMAENVAFLTPEARTNMVQTINSKYQASLSNYKNIENEYNRRIEDAKSGNISGSLTRYDQAYEESNGSGSEFSLSDVDDTIYAHANDYETREQLIEAILAGASNIGRDKIASRVYTLIPDK
jgi:hypothetical protein